MRHYNTGRTELDQLIVELIDRAGGSPDKEFLQEMITTVLRLRDEEVGRGDLKIINTALKELRYAFKIFTPYRHIRKVALFGSARTPSKDKRYLQAAEFGREIVRHGWMVITGGATGVMHAGNEGAGRERSFGVNIRLPFEQEANPIIAKDHKLINFKYFFTRKLIFLKESDATILFPGGYGTHDEGFETLTLVQTGKASPRPIVCIDPPKSQYWASWRRFIVKALAREKMIDADDLGIITYTHSATEAAQLITDFYSNYHSMRFVGDLLVVRMQRPMTKSHIQILNRRYTSLLHIGKFEQSQGPLPEEENEPETHHFPRLVFRFNRRDFSKLYKLINFINEKMI
jgi:uncharacterized protein (TIGR00730 family)